ncbi:MAG: hemerythrin family protein [Pseudomonadota bacterium]
MPSLIWRADMALGMPSIDQEHAQLLQALSDAARAPAQGKGAALRALAASMESHFAQEEILMQDLRYAGLDAHHAQHRRVLDMLHDAERAHAAQQPGAGRATLTMLAHWFSEHLATMDLALAVALHLSAHDFAAIAAIGRARAGGAHHH